jgi:hypothetical protein
MTSIKDNSWVYDLPKIPLKKVYSQFGEEPLFDYIFNNIGVYHKYLVDFGAGGLGCEMSNSRYLMEKGWHGLRMDGNPDPDTDIKQEFITAENIVSLFEKYNVPKNFDFLSIDIDGNDYWVLKEILSNDYRPALIVAEFNGCIPENESRTIKYNPKHTWGENDYYGFSFEAGKKLAKLWDYSLIHQVATTNMYFLHNHFLGGRHDFGVNYKRNQYHAHAPNREWVNV